MLINKHVIQDYFNYNEKDAHNMMSIIVTKCATTTSQVRRTHIAHGHSVEALVSLTSCKAIDVLKEAQRLLGNDSNKRINKARWKLIEELCIFQINKGLV